MCCTRSSANPAKSLVSLDLPLLHPVPPYGSSGELTLFAMFPDMDAISTMLAAVFSATIALANCFAMM